MRVSDARYLDRVRAVLPPGAEEVREGDSRVVGVYSLLIGGAGERRGVRRFHALYSAYEQLARSMDLEEVLATLEHALHFGQRRAPW